WLKEQLGISSGNMPRFPEFDARGRRLEVHRCTMSKGQPLDVYL
ncbi:unnamed protein product, partial [Choristocarpus tenellus]